MTIQLNELSNLATIFGFIFTVILLSLGFIQYKHSKKIEEAKMWLELKKLFIAYDFIHELLTDDEAWEVNQKFNDSKIKNKIDGYFSLIELCLILNENKLINKKTFVLQYNLKFKEIKSHNGIMEYIENNKNSFPKLYEFLQNYNK